MKGSNFRFKQKEGMPYISNNQYTRIFIYKYTRTHSK
jgi:hypothetical protein